MTSLRQNGPAILLCMMGIMLGMAVVHSFAQPRESRETIADEYQYVGVEQTIARVHRMTGKVEILSVPDDPRASLLMPGKRAWAWRKLTVRTDGAVRPGSNGNNPGSSGPGYP